MKSVPTPRDPDLEFLGVIVDEIDEDEFVALAMPILERIKDKLAGIERQADAMDAQMKAMEEQLCGRIGGIADRLDVLELGAAVEEVFDDVDADFEED